MPYAGSDISGIPTLTLSDTGSIQIYQAPVLPPYAPLLTGSSLIEKPAVSNLLPQLTLPQ